MPTETPLPKDHPMMLAWNTYQASQEYANSFKWAAMHEHRDGSMWAAFCVGYESAQQSVQRIEPICFICEQPMSSLEVAHQMCLR